jgi:hypothetical protein
MLADRVQVCLHKRGMGPSWSTNSDRRLECRLVTTRSMASSFTGISAGSFGFWLQSSEIRHDHGSDRGLDNSCD